MTIAPDLKVNMRKDWCRSWHIFCKSLSKWYHNMSQKRWFRITVLSHAWVYAWIYLFGRKNVLYICLGEITLICYKLWLYDMIGDLIIFRVISMPMPYKNWASRWIHLFQVVNSGKKAVQLQGQWIQAVMLLAFDNSTL